mmetsp:Transcript_9047/g.13890  ORF Transcript_9047/g.13890 Transcript_9047/m.13890 type:complete len:81 (+) Transcript_9047:506-748(+)
MSNPMSRTRVQSNIILENDIFEKYAPRNIIFFWKHRNIVVNNYFAVQLKKDAAEPKLPKSLGTSAGGGPASLPPVPRKPC